MTHIGLKSTCALGAFLVVALLALSPAPAAVGQSVRCFEDWSDAAPIVREQGLVPARELQTWVRKKLKGKVISVTLCQDGERYIYRLTVREPKGRIRNRTVDAKGPLEIKEPQRPAKTPPPRS